MAYLQSTDFQTEAALLDQVPLAGRKAELRQLTKALNLCRSGQGKAVLLTGNEGIGKTSLLDTFINLACTHYGCRAVRVTVLPQSSPQILFAQTIENILGMSRQILHETLHEANGILQELGIRWTQSDLIRIVALMRLQESVGSGQAFAVDQLTQVIYEGVPFFKRLNPAVKTKIQQLAQLLFDPWVTIAVSLVNPINPQVQRAVSLVRQSLGTENPALFSVTQTPPPVALLGSSSLPAGGANPPTALASKLQGPELKTNQDIPDADAVDETHRGEQVAVASAQTLGQALADLLVFINGGLRQQQTAFILAYDQWENLCDNPEGVRKDLQDMWSDVLKQTVEQRDFRLMFMVSCQSEMESYALNNTLYNALRLKLLISPLAQSAQQRILRERFKAMEIECEDDALHAVLSLCKGNPAWLTLMSRFIELEMMQSKLKMLSNDVYQERFAVRHPRDLLEILFTRLQLNFVGEEDWLLKAIGQLVTAYAYQTFTTDQAESQVQAEPGQISRLLDTLMMQGFLTAAKLPEDQYEYEFYRPFTLAFLQEKSRPLQEDIPTQDKVSTLKKVLPLSIQSGELTTEKTRELLAMASALENPELLEFVETNLTSVMAQEEASTETRITILESLALLGTEKALETLLQSLQSDEPAIRETACIQLVPFATRSGLPVAKSRMISAFLPLIHDPQLRVQALAFQFLALCPGDEEQLLSVLLEGSRHADPGIQRLAISGLIRRRFKTPDVLRRYQELLDSVEDVDLARQVLKGLQYFDRDVVAPIYTRFLDQQSLSSPTWMDVLLALMNCDFSKALPFVSQAFELENQIDVQLKILKRLGTRPHLEAERLLIKILLSGEKLAPELRWMAIRSLGWIGQTQEAVRALEAQQNFCLRDEILEQTLRSALGQVAERVQPLWAGEGEDEEDDFSTAPQKQVELLVNGSSPQTSHQADVDDDDEEEDEDDEEELDESDPINLVVTASKITD